MALDVHSRRKYRKKGKRHTRNRIEKFTRLWATLVALFDPMTEEEEKIRFPTVGLAEVHLPRGQFLNIGQIRLSRKQGNQFLPDHSAVLFQSFHPLERLSVYDRAISKWRLTCHPVLDGVTELFHRRSDGAPKHSSQIHARARSERHVGHGQHKLLGSPVISALFQTKRRGAGWVRARPVPGIMPGSKAFTYTSECGRYDHAFTDTVATAHFAAHPCRLGAIAPAQVGGHASRSMRPRIRLKRLLVK